MRAHDNFEDKDIATTAVETSTTTTTEMTPTTAALNENLQKALRTRGETIAIKTTLSNYYDKLQVGIFGNVRVAIATIGTR